MLKKDYTHIINLPPILNPAKTEQSGRIIINRNKISKERKDQKVDETKISTHERVKEKDLFDYFKVLKTTFQF